MEPNKEDVQYDNFPKKSRGKLSKAFACLNSTFTESIKCWVICSLNYRKSACIVISAATLLFLAYLFNFQVDLLTVAICTAFGLLCGINISSSQFSFFISRAAEAVKEDSTASKIQSKPVSGINQLDSLVYSFTQKNERLIESVEEVNNELDLLIERYEILTENLVASVVIRDGAGKIAYCSPFTEVLTGYSLNDIYNSKEDFFLKITHPEDREKYNRSLAVRASPCNALAAIIPVSGSIPRILSIINLPMSETSNVSP